MLLYINNNQFQMKTFKRIKSTIETKTRKFLEKVLEISTTFIKQNLKHLRKIKGATCIVEKSPYFKL